MASEKDLELLDQYVSNRLTAQDKAAFEKKLASDNALKNEFKIQQSLVEKIREARVKELKTMFNSIPVSSLETGTAPIAKAALWVAVAGAVGVGAYLFLKNDSAETQNTASQEQVTKENAPLAGSQPESAPKQESPAVGKEKNTPSVTDEQANTTTPSENGNETSAVPPVTSDASKSEEEPKAPAPIDVFDPTEEADRNRPNGNPEAKSSESTPLHKSSIVVETDSNNKNYTFHYQFKNGKLYLYGTFEKNLYEIMEFFSDNKRTVFLYYKDSYYLLSEENETVKPLAPINDPTLIKKLKDYRGAR
jgi:hypothetical protein